MDVSVSWRDLSREGRDHGHDWRRLLRHVDRIVPWDYATLEGLPPEASRRLASYLVEHVPRSHFYVSVGLWARPGQVSPAALAATVQQALEGGATRIWLTPNDMLSEEHWSLVRSLWVAPPPAVNRPDAGTTDLPPSARPPLQAPAAAPARP